MIYWYAFQSKARKERFLCEQLHMRQIETFFPRIRVRLVNSRRVSVRPYFPGYVFGHVDLEKKSKSSLEWIPGAIRIVNFGGEPVPVPDHLINLLRGQAEVINDSTREGPEKFQEGDLVTIHGGPLSGYEAIFNARLPGRDRVEVLLKMLQATQLRVELSIGQISLRKK